MVPKNSDFERFIAEVSLGHRPIERYPIARPCLQRRAEGRHRRLQLRRPALPRPAHTKNRVITRIALLAPASGAPQAGAGAQATGMAE
jgi:hypothetical protein